MVWREVSRAVLGSGLAAAGLTAASVAFVRSAARGHLYPPTAVPPAPVAVVLGAQVYPDGTPSAFLAARLDLGRLLYERGTVEALIVSGDHHAPEYSEPEAMRRYLVAAGVPTDRIVLDHFGLDTYDSCVRAQRVFGHDRFILVSQTYHLPRAVGTARWLGLDVDGVGDDSVRVSHRNWRRGVIRDQLACVKAVLDLATHRQPVLGVGDADARQPVQRG